jgi:pyruvate/2-oxoglutarate dehydrogenase complex dihydrolipoamide dehydrogenase (E3) component
VAARYKSRLICKPAVKQRSSLLRNGTAFSLVEYWDRYSVAGLSETEAKAQGITYRLSKVPMETNLSARTLTETRGFAKTPVTADRDRILGFTAFGVGAGAHPGFRRPTAVPAAQL